MARKMADSNDGISGEDIVGDVHLTVYRLIDPNCDGGISADPAGDDNGGINGGVVKSILNGRGDMGDRFLTCTRVERVGICKKGLSSAFPDRIHDPPDKDRPDESRVSFLPEVKFYGHQIIGLDLFPNFNLLQKFIYLIEYRPFEGASEI